ncbi:MAG: hypothetical protein JO189_05865 [Deltaproteobacteria bacterium]|nr:hypothetical protein [Deltaproteobacteria bacterium]
MINGIIRCVIRINSWAGYFEQSAEIVGETSTKWRVRSNQTIRLGGRNRWLEPGETVLVPKSAVKIIEEGNHAQRDI